MRFLARPASLAVAMAALTGCGSSVNDPESARCAAPQVTFGPTIALAGHAEVTVYFRCAGAVLADTLFRGGGPGSRPVAYTTIESWSSPCGIDAHARSVSWYA